MAVLSLLDRMTAVLRASSRDMQVVLVLTVLVIGLGGLKLIGIERITTPIEHGAQRAAQAFAGGAANDAQLSPSCPATLKNGEMQVGCSLHGMTSAPEVEGFCDSAVVKESRIIVSGWAIDTAHATKAALVAVAIGDRIRGSVAPSIERADVAERRHFSSPLLSGFTLSLPLDAPLADLNIKVFGVSSEGHVGELNCSAALSRHP